MFKKIRGLTKKTTSPSVENNNTPTYDGPIQKRLVLLYSTRDLAQKILSDCRNVMRSFDDDESKGRNMNDMMSTGASLLNNYMVSVDKDFSTFLDQFQKVYDEVGKVQRTCQSNMEEKVCGPLEAWLHTDFARMEAEIQKLHTLKRTVEKTPFKDINTVEFINTKKSMERQLEVVKTELLKLSQIKLEHMEIVEQFVVVLKQFFEQLKETFEKHGADKWVTDGTQRKQSKSAMNGLDTTDTGSTVDGGEDKSKGMEHQATT